MRRNSNYFGDISQFFLKAKRQEKIELDPEIKNRIKSSLELKIQDLKYQPIEPIEEPMPVERINPVEKVSFWHTWRYQFIGVPASLFALLLIVFAANNFKFPLSPTKTIEDKPTISATPEKTTEKIEKSKPELLVLDINDMGKRTLNEFAETTTQKSQPSTTVKTTPAVTTSAPSTTSADTPVANSQATQDSKIDQQTGQTETETEDAALPAEQTQDSLSEPVEEEQLPEETNDVQPENIVPETPQVTPEETTPAPSTFSKTYDDQVLSLSKNVLLKKIKEDGCFVSYYGTSSLSEPVFDKSIIKELISGKSASTVNVYYTDATHATVEITDGRATKYYSYEQKGLEWTVTKFWSSK